MGEGITKIKSMFNLTDLPDKPGTTKAENITSIAKAMKRIARGLAVSTAKDNGCVTVWTDNKGFYRCESQRYMITQSALSTKKLTEVKVWLVEWLKRIE
jgi:hypothetical protein